MEHGERRLTISPERVETNSEKGARWLRLLGRDELIGTPLPYYYTDGTQLMAEDFPDLCGEHVEPTFRGLEKLDPDDPRRSRAIEILIETLDHYLNQSP